MSHPETTPVLVVGAGPAGASAAMWLHNFGVPFYWVDATGEIGGTVNRLNNEIANFPGGPFADGPALSSALKDSLQPLALAPTTAEIDEFEIAPTAQSQLATTADGHRLQARRVLLATGTAYRRLDIPGEKAGQGRYISQSATGDGHRFAGRPVAVVGAGDAAFENALVLADHDCEVTLLARRPEFRARPAFVEKVRAHPKITIAPIPSRVLRIEPRDSGCRLVIDQQGQTITDDVACLFVRIGVHPRCPKGCENLRRDGRGFLIADDRQQTSHPGFYAAGDLTATPLRSVVTAAGSGARAAKSCAQDLGFL